MRIAVFTDSYFPYISGVSSAVAGQTEALSRRGHEIIIFCPNYKRLQKKGVNERISIVGLPATFAVPIYKGLDLALPTVLKSLRILRRFKPDIIHAGTEGGVGWEGLICSKALQAPIVSTFHTFIGDPEYLKHIGLSQYQFAQRAAWSYSILFHNGCDQVICPSRVMREEAIRHGLTRPSSVLSNGISLEAPGPHPSKIQDPLGKHSFDEYNLVYVGRVSTEKSIDIVLKALRIVLIDNPKVRLFIIGDGPMMPELKSYARRYKMAKNVVFTGKINHDVLIRSGTLKHFYAFVSASKTENQPMSMMEAMAAGLPIIGVSKLGVPELVRNNRNGFLAEPDDYIDFARQLIVLLKKRQLRNKMSAASLKMIKSHSMVHVVENLERIYLLAARSRKKARRDVARLNPRIDHFVRKMVERFRE